MDPRTHHLLDLRGTRIHAVEEGTGPLVLLIHGFPESWYSWRHQLTALAEAGYRAVAIDQRGYGRSSKFWAPESYRIRRLVEDAVGVVHALGESKAVVVGHDWGAPVAWTSAWLHPEVFRGVVGLSVPFSGRGLVALPGSPFGERRPDELHAELAGPGQDFYQDYLGTLGPVIEEFESDLRGWIRDGVFSLSGDALAGSGLDFDAMDPVALIRGSAICVPHGTRMRDRFMAPTQLPAWFSEQDLDFYTNEFERSGLAGPLSYYREITASWESLESHADQPLTPPAMCILGEFDVVRSWGLEALARAQERMPNYLGTRVLAGCGHWTQQERATETSAALIGFLQALPPLITAPLVRHALRARAALAGH